MMKCVFLVLLEVAAMIFCVVAADAVAKAPEDWLQLSLQDKKDWTFADIEWNQSVDGLITAPLEMTDEDRAFYTKSAYKDFEAQFEFRPDSVWTDPGFIFRGTDASHYYLVHFPYVGQQYRAEHFWACISKVGDSGYVQALSMEMVHGISSAPGLWHKVRLVVKGDTIQLWVDGRPLRPVVDSTYSHAGLVGLVTSGSMGGGPKSTFRSVRISGRRQKPGWNGSVKRVKPYFVITNKSGAGCGNICRAPNGDLLVSIENRILSSKDNGRTWKDTDNPLEKQSMPDGVSYGLMYATLDKGLAMITVNNTKPPFVLSRAISRDSARSWEAVTDVGTVTFPEKWEIREMYPNCILRLKDGTLLMFAYATPADASFVYEGRYYRRPTALGGMGFCIRSEDDGKTWSAPINIDGPPHEGSWLAAKEFSETSAAQTKDGRVVALTRPFASPVMWETWSEDGGKTWTPQARGPFPMYACNNSMTATASGNLIIAGRFPGMGAQVSRDGGMTWQCYKIDNAGWANGATFEVEPDVVLYIYGGKDSVREMRGQLMRITPEGLEPVLSGQTRTQLKFTEQLRGHVSWSEQYGHDRADFTVSDARGFVVFPAKTQTQPIPWVWYAPTFIGALPRETNGWVATRLLAKGIALCGVEVGESFGSPKGRATFTEFHKFLIKECGFSPKPCLWPQSRGGLMLYNWAVEHPESVACIAGTYTACNLESYPGLADACGAYDMTESELRAHLNEHNPIDRLAPLARHKVPILHIHGDQDASVPLDANSGELCRRYTALGGEMELIVAHGIGHAEVPEFFEDQRFADFLIKNALKRK